MATGSADAPAFHSGFPSASPDMNAYLALQLEAQSRLAKALGEDEAIVEKYASESKAMIERIIKAFWDGERWTAYNPDTGRRSDTQTISLMGALLLGKRLPEEIIEKTVSTLMEEGKYLTPYGFATEVPDSPYFKHGFAQGSVIPPAQLIFCLALEASGRFEDAKKAGLAYMSNLCNNGLFHTHNALTGKPERGMVALDEKFLFWSAWSSSIYLFMAKRYGK
jgi:glycogen debranching enzyme